MDKSSAGGRYPSAVAAGGFIYLSGISVPDAAADVGGQTRQIIGRLGDALARAGASLHDVVAVMVYLRSAADFPAMNAAYGAFWPADPPTRTTIVANRLDPDSLVEMSAVAVSAGGDRVVVRPSDWIASPSPYSYAVRSRDLVFLSGLVSRNGRDNSVVAGDVSTQTRVILDNAGELLHAAGLGFEHVVSARVFLPDASMFGRMNETYATYFRSTPPARATVAAGLAGSQYVVEISLIASSERATGIEPGPARYPGLPLSAAIRAGKRLFVSGTLGNPGDTATQTHLTLQRIGRVLETAGLRREHVVDATVFVTEAADEAAVRDVFSAFFPGRGPAGTIVRTGLVAPDAVVEIAVTAVG